MGTVSVERGIPMSAVGRKPGVSAMATTRSVMIASSCSGTTAMGTIMMTHAMVARAVRVAGRGNNTRTWNKGEKPY